MIDQSAARALHPLEVKIIVTFDAGALIDSARVRDRLGFKEGQDQQAFSWLVAKGVLEEADRQTEVFYELTPLGREWHDKGTPVRRIFMLLKEAGPLSLPDIAQRLGFDQKTVGSAFGALSKEGVCAMDEARRAILVKPELPQSSLDIEALLIAVTKQGGSVSEKVLSPQQKALMAQIAKKRGAQDAPFRIAERARVLFRVMPSVREYREAVIALGMTGEELGAITPEMLEKGTWKGGNFRPYNLQIPPARVIPGRRNAYVEFLDSVKDKLVSLGFEELTGIWWRRNFGIRMRSSCRSFTLPGISTMSIISKNRRTPSSSKSPICRRSPQRTSMEALQAVGAGSISSTETLRAGSFCGARAQCSRRASFRRPKYRANILALCAASAMTASMRRTSPISIRPKVSSSAKM